MNTKVTIPRWLACVVFGMSVGFVYFAVTLLLAHWGWNHKIGDKAWLDAVSWILSGFPFGRWIDDGWFAVLFNGLFWSAVGGALFAFRVWRRHAV
jgi:hypothetical protein